MNYRLLQKLPEYTRKFWREYFLKYPNTGGSKEVNELRDIFDQNNPPCIMCSQTVTDHAEDCIAYVEATSRVQLAPPAAPNNQT